MTGPRIDVDTLSKQLGPTFNYQGLATLFAMGREDMIPEEHRELARQLISRRYQQEQVASGSSFASDRIAQGAIPMGPTATTPGPSLADTYRRGISMLMQGLAGGPLGNPMLGLLGGAVDPTQTAMGAATSLVSGQTAKRLTLPMMQEFGHQISVGLIPEPEMATPEAQAAWDMVVKPTMTMGAMATQGAGLVRLLGYSSKLPRAAAFLEQVPQRLKDVGVGVLVAGAVDAARAEGLPEDPFALDFSARWAEKIAAAGVPDRLALGIGGALFGGVVSGVGLGISRGIQFGRETSFLRQMTPDVLESMRKALVAQGVEVSAQSSPRDIVRLFSGLRKAVLDDNLAGMVGDRLAREEFIVNELFEGTGIQPMSEEGKYLAALFRTNPGGITVATDITNTAAVDEASRKLGLRLQFMRVKVGERIAEQPLVPGFVRLYRGETAVKSVGEIPSWLKESPEYKGTVQATGRWFSDNRSAAEYYAKKFGEGKDISYVDIPKADIEKYRVSNQPDVAKFAAIGRGKEEFFVSPDIAASRQPLTTTTRAVYDLIISRPRYEYGSAAQAGGKTERVSRAIRTLSTEKASTMDAVASNEAWLLPDGTPIRGNFNIWELDKRLKLPAPVIGGVERPDLAVKFHGQVAKMTLLEDNKIRVELPYKMTQEQFESFGRMFDAHGFKSVELVSANGTSTVLERPLGNQVQEAVTNIVKPVKTSSPLTPALVSQYKKQGMFEGQAAVLSDGTPARVIGKRGLFIEVQDPLTGSTRRVHPKRITLLPTTLTDEYAPSTMFLAHLDETERTTLARLRTALSQDLGTEIKSFRQLEAFAATRGFFAKALKGGQFELTHSTGGDPQVFTGMPAAIEYVRKSIGPMPELTPVQVNKVLGIDINMGVLGLNGPPPRIGEVLPLPWDRLKASMDQIKLDRVPGGWEKVWKPSFTLLADLDKRLGTRTLPVFMRLQSQQVAKGNFEALWYDGQGGKLPNGVKPLRKIEEIAGRDANAERITSWLEVPKGTPEEQAILATMTKGEVEASKELRKWYDALFTEFGIEADYLENYAPHWRVLAEQYGNNPLAIWQATGGNRLNAMPKALEFFADQYREGTLDIYDLHSFRMAINYLRQGASNRFMKEAFQDATQMVKLIAAKNQGAAMPLADIVYSMKGMEFFEQRASLQESVLAALEHLPGSAPTKLVKAGADQLTNAALGAVYTSAMGARPGVALRNALSAIVMVWPVFGGATKTDFMEAIGRAFTRAGRDAAIADNAVALKQGPILMREEIESMLPKELHEIAEKSFALYDSADQFTRATAYWAARLNTEKALRRLAEGAMKGTTENVTKLRQQVIRHSGLYIQDQQVIDEFWRLAAHDPDKAARFAGKVGADVTNFLYGRGMQPRWMRSVGGRFFGQFGTWSMGYVDYLRRLTGAAARNSEFRGEALRALGRHAIVNAAIVVGGHEILDLDVGRWAAYPSIFFSGGPGWQLAMGVTTLMRGAGSHVSGSDDPLARSRITEGVSVISHTIPSFIPYYGVSRDAVRFMEADTPMDRLGAVLSTKPTRQYTLEQSIEAMFGPPLPFVTDSPAIEAQLNGRAFGTGSQEVDVRTIQNPAPQVLPTLPERVPTSRGPTTTPAPASRGRSGTVQSTVPPGVVYNPEGEATGTIETQPSSLF